MEFCLPVCPVDRSLGAERVLIRFGLVKAKNPHCTVFFYAIELAETPGGRAKNLSEPSQRLRN